jgi:hypothetical protein
MTATGVSKGAAAGIGVGAGLFGMAVGWLVWVFGRRCCPDRRLTEAESPHSSPEQPRSTAPLRLYLLDGPGESELEHELRALSFLIHQHVVSNYRLGSVRPNRDSLDQSLRPLSLSEDTRSLVVKLALNPSTQYIAIRHLLAHTIFSNLDIHSVGSLSLLPPAVNMFIQSLPFANIYEQTPPGI